MLSPHFIIYIPIYQKTYAPLSLRLVPFLTIWHLAYRAKRTAGHLRVIRIVTRNPLKTKRSRRWKQSHVRGVLTFEPASIFMHTKKQYRPIQGRCFHYHNLNTDRKRRLFKFRKGHSVPKEDIRSGFVIVQSNVDQRYDVGPLCLMV